MAETLVLTKTPQNVTAAFELEEGGVWMLQNLASTDRALWLMQPAAPVAPLHGFILPAYGYLALPTGLATEVPPLWMWALKLNTVRILGDLVRAPPMMWPPSVHSV